MDDVLNPAQRRSVQIALRIFEENLRQLMELLDGEETNGILYRRKLNLSSARRRVARKRVTAALEEIAALAIELGLEQEAVDPAGWIRGEMSESWATLIDTESHRLGRFGKIDPGLESVLDPAIRRLSQLALELSIMFDGKSAT